MNKPCNNCEHSILFYKRQVPNIFDEECQDCERKNKYDYCLEKKRKYEQGVAVENIDSLLEQEFIYVRGKIFHIEAIKSRTLRNILDLIKGGYIFTAVKK